MSALELVEWHAYYRLEPFGSLVHRKGHALTASVVANANRKKGARPFKVGDFMHDFDSTKPAPLAQPASEQIAIAEALNKAWGGKDLRKPANGD